MTIRRTPSFKALANNMPNLTPSLKVLVNTLKSLPQSFGLKAPGLDDNPTSGDFFRVESRGMLKEQ